MSKPRQAAGLSAERYVHRFDIDMHVVKKFLRIAVVCLVFLLPLQTRYIFSVGQLGRYTSEYQTVSVYGTEILSWVVAFLGISVYHISVVRFWKTLARKKKILIVCGVGLLALSVIRSLDALLSVYTLYRWLLAVSVGFVVYRVAREIGLNLLYIFSLQGFFQASLGLYQFFTQTLVGSKWFGMSTQLPQTLGVSVVENDLGRWLRAYGSFGWPTSLGIYLAVAIVASFILFLHTKCRYIRTSLLIMIPGMMAGLFVTLARGAWLATGFGLLYICGVCVRDHVRTLQQEYPYRWRDCAVLCAALGVLVVSYALIISPLTTTRLSTNARLERQSVSERVLQYQDAWNIVQSHPVVGVGPGMYTGYLYTTHPDRTMPELQPVHSVHALLVAECGILLAMLIAIFCVQVGYGIFLGTTGALAVSLSVAGLFDHWLLSMWGGVLCVAVGVGLSGAERGEPKEKPPVTVV